jgi:hypothetical protein
MPKENLRAVAHQDMISLLKEYARIGFREVHDGTDKGFEELWQKARVSDHVQEKPRLL